MPDIHSQNEGTSPQQHRIATELGLDASEVTFMETTGLAHKHYRLACTAALFDQPTDFKLLVRVPIQSQHGLEPKANLTYQAACFERVAETGHGPRLVKTLDVQPDLPFGALIVEEIEGRHAILPDDLKKIATCLARIHAHPGIPAAPLAVHKDPLPALKAEIAHQAQFLNETSGKALKLELDWLDAFKGDLKPRRAEPTCLVCTDTHPGNFLIDAKGKAVIVDLEKALYGSPGIDLAHTSVYTSTTWDLNSRAVLEPAEVLAFYQTYLEASSDSERIQPWLKPMRRILQLRALTWCAMWQHEHQRETSAWSKDLVPDALTKHVAERTSHYLEPATIERMLDEANALEI